MSDELLTCEQEYLQVTPKSSSKHINKTLEKVKFQTSLCAAAKDSEHVVMATDLFHHLHLVYQIFEFSLAASVCTSQVACIDGNLQYMTSDE